MNKKKVEKKTVCVPLPPSPTLPRLAKYNLIFYFAIVRFRYLPTCAGQQLPQPYPSSIVAPEQRKQLIVVIIVAAAFLLTLICLVIVVCLKY